MTNKGEIYKCNVCTNVVEVTQEGAGTLVCCGEDMEKMTEHQATNENAHYGHLEKTDDITYMVTFNHVATNEHHIEYIEAISNDGKYIKRKYLEETEKPEITFKCDCQEGFYIRLLCNLDGVWTTKY